MSNSFEVIEQKSDAVNHPSHYGGVDNIYEAIKVIRAWNLGFSLGNTVKYICRAGKKAPDGLAQYYVQTAALQDLKKARWYLDEEIKTIEQSMGTTPAQPTRSNCV